MLRILSFVLNKFQSPLLNITRVSFYKHHILVWKTERNCCKLLYKYLFFKGFSFWNNVLFFIECLHVYMYYRSINWWFILVLCYFFSSPELKAQVSFSCSLLSIGLSVCKLFTFSSSSQEPLGQFQPNLIGTKHPCVKGIQVCSNDEPKPFPRGDNYEIAKIHSWNLKIFFSRTNGPISTKLGSKLKLGEGNSNLFKWIKGNRW